MVLMIQMMMMIIPMLMLGTAVIMIKEGSLTLHFLKSLEKDVLTVGERSG